MTFLQTSGGFLSLPAPAGLRRGDFLARKRYRGSSSHSKVLASLFARLAPRLSSVAPTPAARRSALALRPADIRAGRTARPPRP
jgi:hypothetical protein